MIQKKQIESVESWLAMRKKNLNSTEISSLFAANPYQTAFQLWHHKKGTLDDSFSENERMFWGKELEDAIVKGWTKKTGGRANKFDFYLYDDESRLGSSFDYIQDDGTFLEVKNVDSLVYHKNWEKTDTGVTPPLHIFMQVQHQMMLTNTNSISIIALVGGNNLETIKVMRDDKVIDLITSASKTFWDSIDNNKEPMIDWAEDASAIMALHSTAVKGTVLDCSENGEFLDICGKYNIVSQEIKRLEKEKEICKSQILSMIGDNAKAISKNYTVSADMVEAKTITYERKAYRNFRVTSKGVKNEQ